jgi:hypothetical protein
MQQVAELGHGNLVNNQGQVLLLVNVEKFTLRLHVMMGHLKAFRICHLTLSFGRDYSLRSINCVAGSRAQCHLCSGLQGAVPFVLRS